MNNQNDQNKFIFECNVKFQLLDYRLRFLSKKTWIYALILMAFRIAMIFYGRSPP